MEKIIIKKMEIQDLKDIESILETDFDNFWSASILKSELEKNNSLYFVAKIGKEIVGFAGITINIDFNELMNIVVRKDFRKQGIGKLLLEKIIEESNEMKKQYIYLEVNEKNENAINLYKSFQFVEVGRRKKYYDGKNDAILMNLKLY